MQVAIYLWASGSTILLLLGLIHFYFTFWSNKFEARDSLVNDKMRESNLILTKETTMWRAWIGFNASHSLGAIFIGTINLFLVLCHFELMSSGHFFFWLNIITILFYLWLAKRYWFSKPFLGILITLVCFLVSYSMVLSV